ncbi:MAG: DNA polymerase III subunit gamma/tau, partial [Oscillospiraceae bacterium]|nr:DNA polymerase III subunit gamma/tau [Oscillospiraceae bacterium]
AEQEQIALTKQAAALIARIADGGMRDAISLLDRCAAYGTEITEEVVAESAGTAGREYLPEILKHLCAKNIPELLRLIAELYENSKDLQRLCDELILMQRDMMLLKATGDTGLLHSMPEEIPVLQEMTAQQDMQKIMQILEHLQICRERMNRSLSKRTELELACIRICQEMRTDESRQQESPVNSGQLQELYARIAQLEQGQPGQARPDAPATANPVTYSEPKPEIDMKNIKLSDFQRLSQWSEILEECSKINPAVTGSLAGSEAVFHANMILITAQNPLFLTMFKQPENAISLGDAVEHVMGRRYVIRAKCAPGASKVTSIQEMLERAKSSGIPTTAV